MKKRNILKLSLAMMLMTTSLTAGVHKTTINIEADKLKQQLKKEIEIINMLESYILLNAPNNGVLFDMSNVNRQAVQSFYNLPNSFFTNYSGEKCNIDSALNLCLNDGSGVGIIVSNNMVTLTNLVGSKITNRNRNMFKRMHKKYKSVMFNSTFNTSGTISRSVSDKILTLKRNLNLYLKDPYPNSYIGYLVPTDTNKIWVRPNGEGSFNTYSFDTTLNKWNLLSKNVIQKFPTYGNYENLENVDSFDGAIMYSRYSNDESDYLKYGEMEYINTGVYPGTTTERWSVKAANNRFITDRINITSTCLEQKNPLIGIDADKIATYKYGSTNETIEDSLSITVNANTTTIHAQQAMIKFRDSYEFVLDESDPNKNVLFDYRDPSFISAFQGEYEGNKKLNHNLIRFQVFNKITGKMDNVKNIKINSVTFITPISHSKLTYVINSTVDNSEYITLNLSSSSQTQLDNLGLTKYKATILPSGYSYGSSVPGYEINSADIGKYYSNITSKAFDGNFDKVKGFPMVVDFSVEVDSMCDDGKSYHDCYLVQTATHGCYISKTRAETITN